MRYVKIVILKPQLVGTYWAETGLTCTVEEDRGKQIVNKGHACYDNQVEFLCPAELPPDVEPIEVIEEPQYSVKSIAPDGELTMAKATRKKVRAKTK